MPINILILKINNSIFENINFQIVCYKIVSILIFHSLSVCSLLCYKSCQCYLFFNPKLELSNTDLLYWSFQILFVCSLPHMTGKVLTVGILWEADSKTGLAMGEIY